MAIERRDLEDEIRNGWETMLGDTVHDLKLSSVEIATYMADRAFVLASAFGEPGYMQAVDSAAKALLHRLEIQAIDDGDRLDLRITGWVRGALQFAGQLVAVAV